MAAKRKPERKVIGHPDPVVRKLHKVNEMAVELVRDLQGRLTEQQFIELRAGALGLLITEALLTNKPDPRELMPVEGHAPPPKEETLEAVEDLQPAATRTRPVPKPGPQLATVHQLPRCG